MHNTSALALGVVALAGCFQAPVAKPDPSTYQETPIRVPQNERNKVDVLFMVDNSPSMGAMQAELQAKFGQFFAAFEDLATNKHIYADLHVGVVTSDYGAGPTAVTRGCDASPGGDRGHLQQRGVDAAAGCQGPSDRFISYAFTPSGAAASNLPPGQDLVQTFTCMASVGSNGCGFEHQLESVYAALKDFDGYNAGFLRSDAILTVVFVTNEDDGSAPPGADFYSNAAAKVAQYGAYDTYRQTRFGLACDDPPMSPPYPMSGPLSPTCRPTPPLPAQNLGGEYDVQRYIDLFKRPPAQGGIKKDPENDVILVAIDAPVAPFTVITAEKTSGNGSGAAPRYVACAPADGGSCVVRLDHSCQNDANPAFFGDPPLRLNAVVNTITQHAITNICGDDLSAPPDYSGAMNQVAALISIGISPGCIPAPLADVDHPDCVVEDITLTDNGAGQVTPIAQCDATTPAYPCWRVESKDACSKFSPQSVGVTIDRGPGGKAPVDTSAHVECTTIAQPAQR